MMAPTTTQVRLLFLNWYLRHLIACYRVVPPHSQCFCGEISKNRSRWNYHCQCHSLTLRAHNLSAAFTLHIVY